MFNPDFMPNTTSGNLNPVSSHSTHAIEVSLETHVIDQMWHQWAASKLFAIIAIFSATSTWNAVSQVVVHTRQMCAKAIMQIAGAALITTTMRIITIITIITMIETARITTISKTMAIITVSAPITHQTPNLGFLLGSQDHSLTISTKIGNLFHY
jgi:hypothetical protein